MQQCSILNISLEIQKRILRYLLKSTRPLVLGPDASSSSVDYHAEIEPQILQVSSQLYQLGRLILYGENIFTISSLSSSSAISYDLDSRLTTILGKYRLLISRIILQIDRAEQLWTVFPLLAKILAELPLKTFMISIVEKGQGAKKGRAALTAASENTSNFARDEARGDGFHEERDITDTTLTVEKSGNKTTLHGEKKEAEGSENECIFSTENRTRKGKLKRQSSMGDVMLEIEKKMVRELVGGFKSLRCFRLEGFGDEEFARGLEELVRGGGRMV